jgi:hypothetical protein
MNSRIVKNYLGGGFYITKEPTADGKEYTYWLGFQDTDPESPLQFNSYKISIDEVTYRALKTDRRIEYHKEESY